MLPDPLPALIGAALSEMQSDPLHRLSPRRRHALYAAFAGAADPALHPVPCWLGVLAAERVLPLFRQACPNDELPPALLAAAASVLEGRMDEAQAAALEASGFQASRTAWGHEEAELPWPVGLAADAAYHALKEARGYQPLDNLDAYLRLGTVQWAPSEAERPPASVEPAPGGPEALNDEALCQLDNTDTAAIAAVAAASADFGPTCDPARLQAFWTWWLREAIPAAVEAARARTC